MRQYPLRRDREIRQEHRGRRLRRQYPNISELTAYYVAGTLYQPEINIFLKTEAQLQEMGECMQSAAETFYEAMEGMAARDGVNSDVEVLQTFFFRNIVILELIGHVFKVLCVLSNCLQTGIEDVCDRNEDRFPAVKGGCLGRVENELHEIKRLIEGLMTLEGSQEERNEPRE